MGVTPCDNMAAVQTGCRKALVSTWWDIFLFANISTTWVPLKKTCQIKDPKVDFYHIKLCSPESRSVVAIEFHALHKLSIYLKDLGQWQEVPVGQDTDRSQTTKNMMAQQ